MSRQQFKVFGVSGKLGSGKTEAILGIARALASRTDVRVVLLNFADSLKELLAHIFNFDVQLCYTTAGKMCMIESAQCTVEQGLQKLGESMRREFGEQFWIEQVRQKMESEITSSPIPCLFLIGDVRHVNEIEFIRNFGGATVRLVGDPGGVAAKSTRNHAHISETALDQCEAFDCFINTNANSIEQVVDICLSKMQKN